MSGFSDEFYKELKSRYSQENGNISQHKKWYFDVDDSLRPDGMLNHCCSINSKLLTKKIFWKI